MEVLHRRVAGIDVHRMLHVATVLIEQEDGTVAQQTRRFGGFKKDMRALAVWLAELRVELAIMESTGIYWKSAYAHLEAAGIAVWVVNAHHIKQVPGRKTDVADSAWLAQLGRFGLVKASFIPDVNLRELRLVSHYRKKLAGTLAGEKNRLHKVLDDAGIKLGDVVSDINGVSAKAMIEGLLQGKAVAELAQLGRGAVRKKQAALADAMEGGLPLRHRLVLREVVNHIRYLEEEIGRLDRVLLEAMAPYAWAHRLLQTLPGIDEIGAAMIPSSRSAIAPSSSVRPTGWRRGRHCVRATTRVPASARAARRGTAIRWCATCCARRRTRRAGPRVRSRPATTAW